MNVIKTEIDRDSEKFKQNTDAMHGLINDWREKLGVISQGGSEKARKKHTGRGKLLPRDRITLLLDEDSPFLEISPFAGFEVYDEEVPAAGIIAGIGRIAQRECMVVSNDATV